MKKGREYELKSLHFEVLCSFFLSLALYAYRVNQISGGKNEKQNEKKMKKKKPVRAIIMVSELLLPFFCMNFLI